MQDATTTIRGSSAGPDSAKRLLLRVLPPAYFLLLSVLVWGQALFARGYVLLGDMVFTPAMNPVATMWGPPRGTMNVALVLNLAWLLSRVLSAMLLQKAVLLLMAFLPGYLMYRCAPLKSRWAALFAGTLYAVNPFVYTRMLIGHWGLLLGYACLPVVLASSMKTCREPTTARAARTALWITGTAVLSVHLGVIAAMVYVAVFLFSLVKRRERRRRTLVTALALVLVVTLCAFWIVPALNPDGPGALVGTEDVEAFSSRTNSSAGTVIAVLGMYGFWKTQLDPLMPMTHLPPWPVFALILLLLCIVGVAGTWREPTRGPIVRALAVLFVIGLFLSLGTAAPLTGGAFRWLYEHASFLRVFREPQKFSAMLALGYAVLGGLGVERIQARTRRRKAGSWKATAAVTLCLVALTTAYTYRMFGGLCGEARAVEYPSSWEQAERVMDADPGDHKALYLPPYWYMRFDFAGSTNSIASPMPFYFTQAGVEMFAINVWQFRLDAGPVDEYVRQALDSAQVNGNLGAILAPLNVRYVLLTRNSGITRFDYVARQKDMEVVLPRSGDIECADLVLLRNRVPVSRVLETTLKGTYSSWSAAAQKARGSNLTGSYLVEGGSTRIPPAAGRPLPHESEPFGGVSIPGDALRRGSTVIFCEPVRVGWRMDGRPPSAQLGLTCAFGEPHSGPGGVSTIAYHDPYLLGGYSLSAVGLVSCLVLCVAGAVLRRRGREAT